MNRKILEIAAKTIKSSVEDAEKHNKYLDDLGAYYFWNPSRGGISVIIRESGEKLAATSSISLEKHKLAFASGKRN